MKQKKCILFFLLLIAIISGAFSQTDKLNSNQNKIRIRQMIFAEIEHGDTIGHDTTTFVYDDYGLMIKGIHPNGNYFINEYDSLKRLIRTTSYTKQGPSDYSTFQYDSNTMSMIRYHQYDSFYNSWGGGNEKSIFYYDSVKQCQKIEYYHKYVSKDTWNYEKVFEKTPWEKSEYHTVYYWDKNNVVEIKHFKDSEIEFIETFQYDDKYNPEKLFSNLISNPWRLTTNNAINRVKRLSDGRSSTVVFKYVYNNLGYPIKKITISKIGASELGDTKTFIYDQ